MIAFSIGSINIYRYGIMYFISFIVGYIFLYYLGKRTDATNKPFIHHILTEKLDDLIISIIIGIMLGGRLGVIFIYDFAYYMANPNKIFAVREGGMSFIGGIIGVVISIAIFTHRQNRTLSFKRSVLSITDHLVTIVPLGIALGRIGNFLNQELYGTIVPDNRRGLSSSIIELLQKLHLTHIYPLIGPEWRINTNILSILGEGALLLIIIQIAYRKYSSNKHIGRLSGIFLTRYSMVRFFLEFLRQDSQTEIIIGMTYSQRRFIAFFILGLHLLIKKRTA